MSIPTTSERRAVAHTQRQMLSEVRVDFRTRDVALAGGLTIQVLETGEGEPLVLWHGSGVNALSMVPLAEQLQDRHVVLPHRPGYGLSDPMAYTKSDIRERSVGVALQLMDALGLDRADVCGNSTGGVWALWTALDRPERVRRVVLAGATPLLPGTAPPLPLRLMSTPGLGPLLDRVMPEASPETVRKMMAGMGEGEAIDRYPRLVEGFVAAAGDPVAGEVAHEELTSMIRGLAGFRPAHRFSPQELAQITHPVLLLWGEKDPVGGRAAADEAASLLRDATVEMLPGGHAPWLDDPRRAAELMGRFLDG